MIATIPKGLCGIDGAPSQSLLRGATVEASKKLVGTPLNFAGGLSLDQETLKSKPSILVPALRDFGPKLQELVDSLHQIQKASQAFRVVVATDMPIFRSLRPYGWAITHIQSELQWDASNGSWNKYVNDGFVSVIRDFGVRLVFDLSSDEALYSSWKKLLAMVGLPENLAPSGLTKSADKEHYSWRGWLQAVPTGASDHVVKLEKAVLWNLEIHKFAGSSMLFASENSSSGRELATAATQRGWNTVLFGMEGRRPTNIEISNALLYLFDGLSFAGAGLVAGLGSDLDTPSVLHATLFAKSATDLEFERAELKALAFWSSHR